MRDKVKILEILKTTPMQDLPKLLRMMAVNQKDTQESVLMDIISRAKESNFGKEHNFAEIDSIEGFRERVPITEFEDYKSYIKRMLKGSDNELFDGKTKMFVSTTGTTGKPKAIPESEVGYMIKNGINKIRMIELLRMLPEVMAKEAKVLTVTNFAVVVKTESGIPIGVASGQAAGGADDSMLEKMILPKEFLLMSEMPKEAADYVTILFGVSEANMAAILCNNPAHFIMLWKLFLEKKEIIINDIANGTISCELSPEYKAVLESKLKANAERAAYLTACIDEKGEAISMAEVWPAFKAVVCWLSGSVGRISFDVKQQMPADVKFLEWGYGASEGKFNIPVFPEVAMGIPAVFGYFFEFLPLEGGEPVLLGEAEDGVMYELIITSYSGLYRYNIHDCVMLKTDEMGIRHIEFIAKTKDTLVIDGKTVTAGFLLQIIKSFEAQKNIHIRHFELLQEDDGKLTFIYEHGKEDVDIEVISEYVNDMLKKEFNISLDAAFKMKDGYRDSLFLYKGDSNVTTLQTKLYTMIHQKPEEAYIREIKSFES